MAKYNKIEKWIRVALKNSKDGKVDTIKLLSSLDLDLTINPRDTYRKEAIIKALILRDLKGLKFETSLEKFLKENKETALELGFLKGANNEVEIPDRRTFSHFLKHGITDEDRELINFVKETVLTISDKFSIPLDSNTKSVVEKGEKTRITEEDKIKNIKYLRNKLYPLITLPVNRNAKWTKEELLDVLVHIASVGKYTNGGAEGFTIKKQKQVKGYTILRHVKRNKIKELTETIDKIIGKQFNEANKALRIKYATIAIDETLIPFYDRGNSRDGKSVYNFVVGGPEKASTFNFVKYLTADIVHPKLKLTLATVPRRAGIPLVEDVKLLINKVRKMVDIKLLLADRGFNGSEMFQMLDKEKVRYLMPLSESGGIKKLIKILPMDSVYKDLEYGSFGYKIPYFVYTEGKKGPIKIATSIEIKKDDIAFIKNLPVIYSQRWTIETGYRDKKRNAFPRTTSTDYVVRLFYFSFSILLYNAWSILNLLLMVCAGLEVLKRKAMTLFSFLKKLYSVESG
jgi:putative transposase